ncbi:hypothetical protein IBTHAUMO2_470027 [Nitrosopumilaceae archaeon]|nr:hypothetical protein IBTHAUMO2_470027 [Nitrosopumilaceae archaeon]
MPHAPAAIPCGAAPVPSKGRAAPDIMGTGDPPPSGDTEEPAGGPCEMKPHAVPVPCKKGAP